VVIRAPKSAPRHEKRWAEAAGPKARHYLKGPWFFSARPNDFPSIGYDAFRFFPALSSEAPLPLAAATLGAAFLSTFAVFFLPVLT
jgi:hypothetical protein